MILVAASLSAQPRFRSGMFLHHSTGDCIWGPNGSEVSVPSEIARYNTARGLSGPDSVTMEKTWWPSNDNEWTTWHDIFEGRGGSDDIQSFLDSYPLVMIKSCFPSANMSGLGLEADTLTPGIKSVANYKWHWRSIVSAMRNRPENFFVIWTNAPQVSGSTNGDEAALSNAFCRWAKDTLAAGLDEVTGEFPANVFVFDFFHQLAGDDGMLPESLASSSSDSHPNAAATALVAPELVTQVFDAALAYENPTGIPDGNAPVPSNTQLQQNWPNPFNPTTTLRYTVAGVVAPSGAILSRVEGRASSNVRLAVYDLLGREVAVLVNESQVPGTYAVRWDASGFPSGIYVSRLITGGVMESQKMMLVK